MVPYSWLQSPSFAGRISWQKRQTENGWNVEVFLDSLSQTLEWFATEAEADEWINRNLAGKT